MKLLGNGLPIDLDFLRALHANPSLRHFPCEPKLPFPTQFAICEEVLGCTYYANQKTVGSTFSGRPSRRKLGAEGAPLLFSICNVSL